MRPARIVGSIRPESSMAAATRGPSPAPQPFLNLGSALHAEADTKAPQAKVDALVNALGSRISLGKTALKEFGLIAHDGCRMAVDPTTGAERKAGAAAIATAGL
jgi:hypothetical protein